MLHKCYEPLYSPNWEGYGEKSLSGILNLASQRYPCVSPLVNCIFRSSTWGFAKQIAIDVWS